MHPSTSGPPVPAAEPRQTLRRGEHATAILEAAHRLINEKSDFTTQELVKEAGVALQTFYRHFTSKDHLLITLIGDLVSSNAMALEADAEANGLVDPMDRLEYFIRWPLQDMNSPTPGLNRTFITSQHWRLHQFYPDEVVEATRPYSDLLCRTIVDGAAVGVLAPRDPERDAWLIATMVMGVFHHYSFHPDDSGKATAAADVWAFCEASLTADNRAVERRRAREGHRRSRRRIA
jgi:AcrR family transcriptional regulator